MGRVILLSDIRNIRCLEEAEAFGFVGTSPVNFTGPLADKQKILFSAISVPVVKVTNLVLSLIYAVSISKPVGTSNIVIKHRVG